jgi:hypothetical protein
MKALPHIILFLFPVLLFSQANQPYFAARAIATDSPTDLGGDLYRITVEISDETGVYNGVDIADDSTFYLITPSSTFGDDINLYPIVNMALQFASQVTIDVRDIASAGAPLMGSQVICEQSPQGLFAYVSGAGDPLNQAISDYNMLKVSQTMAVDSTRLEQDSILIYYAGPSEVGRDTIAGTGGGGGGSDGNGLIDALPAGNVSINAGSNDLTFDDIGRYEVKGDPAVNPYNIIGDGSELTLRGDLRVQDIDVTNLSAGDSLVYLLTSFTGDGLFMHIDSFVNLVSTRAISGTTNTYSIFQSGGGLTDGWLTQDNDRVSLTGQKLFRLIGGTTAQRGTGSEGDFYYNTDDSRPQWYDGASWYCFSPFERIVNGIQYESFTFSAAGDDRLAFGSDGNINIGSAAGNVFATGVNNISVGLSAGASLTTGNNNNNFGVNAGANVTTGGNNNNYGKEAGENNNGANNNNFGERAGESSSSGNFSHMNNFGEQAGRSLVSGAGSNHFGLNAFTSVTTSNGNNAIGVLIGASMTDTNVEGFNGIGRSVVRWATADINKSICIGDFAGDSLAYTNVLLIGTNADAYINNEIVIGHYDDSDVTAQIPISDRLRVGYYSFNIDQDTTGLDDAELVFDSAAEEITLKKTNDHASASATTDGSGDITVSHDLGTASITVTATATGTTFYNVQVHSKTTTTFKIRFFDASGSAVTSTAVTADWIARKQ